MIKLQSTKFVNNQLVCLIVISFLTLTAFAQDLNKYHGGSYDGCAIETSLPNQTIGILVTDKYHGGSYDGCAIETSPQNQAIGILVTDKYHGGSYDGCAVETSPPNQTIGILITDKYNGGSYDGCAVGTSPPNEPLAAEMNLHPKYDLLQNYPNPFNPSTTISFTLPRRMKVHLAIYSVEGRLVKTLVSESYEEGCHKVKWEGQNDKGNQVSSGVYFYRLTAGGKTLTKKMVLLK